MLWRVYPDAGAGHHETLADLINRVHGAMVTHPHADGVANFAKILQALTQQQAKLHATQQTAQTANQHPVTPAAPLSAGAGYQGGQGLAPPDESPGGGYIAENISPILQALLARGGGFQGAHLGAQQFGPPTPPDEGGLLGAILAARHGQFA
jgi:hypothetical protein